MSSGGGSIFGGRKSLFGPEGSDEMNVDLNLTPLMDVMSNILFFLLASFGAAILSFLQASVPVQAEADDEDEAPRTDRVTVTVKLTGKTFKVNASGLGIEPEKLEALKTEIPAKSDSYDYARLKEMMLSIKRQFPASDTVMIVPVDTTVYEQIIHTMEAVKDSRIGDNKKVSLFPKVVVADLVKEDPVPEGAPAEALGAPGAVAPEPEGP
ncbi:MAG: biopolymer transporter ExbD [Deltaproteobacteria bacterium]|nr:biopolymer transporter ExbD [Deltaproteobacteria bacterium]